MRDGTAVGGPVRGEGQHRRRRAVDHRRAARRSPAPRTSATVVGRLVGGGRVRRRQDQPRPVRHRPGRDAVAVRHAASTRSTRRSCPAGRARARRSPSRPGSCRSRSAPTPPGRVGSRPRSATSSGCKPTLGLVSTVGVVPACRSLDCVSVFALTADDAAIVLGVLDHPDGGDIYSRPVAARRQRPPAAATDVVIGVPSDAILATVRRADRRCVRRVRSTSSSKLGIRCPRGRPRGVLRRGRTALRRAVARGTSRRRGAVHRAASRRRPSRHAGDHQRCLALRRLRGVRRRVPASSTGPPCRGDLGRGRCGRRPVAADDPDACRGGRRSDRCERPPRSVLDVRQPPRPVCRGGPWRDARCLAFRSGSRSIAPALSDLFLLTLADQYQQMVDRPLGALDVGSPRRRPATPPTGRRGPPCRPPSCRPPPCRSPSSVPISAANRSTTSS